MPRRRTSPQDAAEALAQVAPFVSRWIERLLASHEPPLTLAQYLALGAVADGEVVASELARRAAVSPAAASQLVAALEAAMLVDRLRGGDDRRRQVLVLTTSGETALRSARALLREQLATLVADLPPPELDALAHGLRQLDRLLAGHAPPRRPPRPPPPPPPPRRPRGPRR